MTDQEIREAVEVLKECLSPTGIKGIITPAGKADEILISLAESYLKVEGLPEKKESHYVAGFPRTAEDGRVQGFNEALDLCRFAIGKLYVKKPEALFIGAENMFNGLTFDELARKMDYLKRSELPSEDEIEEIIDQTYDCDHNGQSFVSNWKQVAHAISERINQGESQHNDVG